MTIPSLQRSVGQSCWTPPRNRQPSIWVCSSILAICIFAVYLPSIHAPFIFDDSATITQNVSIKRLWPLIGTSEVPGPFNAPSGTPTTGRPLVNFSLAINFLFGGLNPVGYHLFSVSLHFFSSVLLWELIRRTLMLPGFAARFDRAAPWLALIVATLWALHPLQTETVIYATQRSELMVSFFYLATLYWSLRYWNGRSTTSLVLASVSCLCGAACKEIMISAPLIVLLYERAFVAGSLSVSIRKSWPLYVGLSLSTLLLLILRIGIPHSEAAGFGLGVPAISWWLTQSKIFLMYLKLAVWPWPLQIHYELPYLNSLAAAWPYVCCVGVLAIAMLVLLWRNHPVGYLGTCVFAILAPTSLIPIVMEMAAERRMYLPLAPLLLMLVMGAYLLFQRAGAVRLAVPRFAADKPLAGVCLTMLMLALSYVVLDVHRVAAYYDKIELWNDVLIRQPMNDTAHVSIGNEFEDIGKLAAATSHYRDAIRYARDPALAHFKLGVALMKQGAHAEALIHFQEAAKRQPENPLIGNNLAAAFLIAGRTDEAIKACRAALVVQPNSWWCHNHLGIALKRARNFREAAKSFERAIQLDPRQLAVYGDLADCYRELDETDQVIDALERGLSRAEEIRDSPSVQGFQARLNAVRKPQDPVARKQFAMTLYQSGLWSDAVPELQQALKFSPNDAELVTGLGLALFHLGRSAEAVEPLEKAAQLEPVNAGLRVNLGQALADLGRTPDAVREFHAALKIHPNDPSTLNELGAALGKAGEATEAIQILQQAVQIKPDYVEAHNNLGIVLYRLGRIAEATHEFQLAIKLDPNNADAHFNLGNALASAGDLQTAISHFQAAANERPNQADLFETLGKALWRNGQKADAIEAYQHAILAQPEFLSAYSSLIQALMSENRSDEAVATAEKAIKAAHDSNQDSAADDIKTWLKHFQAELRRSGVP